MPKKEDSNKKVATIKKQRYEFKNGIYEGGVEKFKRQGSGIAILDDGFIYIGQWRNDKVHGRGLVFAPDIGIIYGNFVKGKQIGLQIIKSYKLQNKYLCIDIHDPVKNPQNAIIFSKDTKTAIQVNIIDQLQNQIISKESEITKELWSLIKDLDNLTMKYDYDLKLIKNYNNVGDKYIKIGFMQQPHYRLNGIGLVVDENTFQILKYGYFQDDKLQGMGKINLQNQDIYEGQFKQDIKEGKGFYYTAKSKSFISGIFQKDICLELISDGLGYPINHLKRYKQTLHEESLVFYSVQLQPSDFISIDLNYLQLFINTQNYIKQEQNGNYSPRISSNLNNTKALIDIQQKANSSYYNNQKNQQNKASNIQTRNQIDIQLDAQQSEQRISNNMNIFKVSQIVSRNNQFLRKKFLKDNAITNKKEYDVENPEQIINNIQKGFEKFNWGTKLKVENLPFSEKNYQVEKEGVDIYDCLNNDEIYKRSSFINYFKSNQKVPTYEETIKEGELIKKRLQIIQSINQNNKKIFNQKTEKQQLNLSFDQQNKQSNKEYQQENYINKEKLNAIQNNKDLNSTQKAKHERSQSQQTAYKSTNQNSFYLSNQSQNHSNYNSFISCNKSQNQSGVGKGIINKINSNSPSEQIKNTQNNKLIDYLNNNIDISLNNNSHNQYSKKLNKTQTDFKNKPPDDFLSNISNKEKLQNETYQIDKVEQKKRSLSTSLSNGFQLTNFSENQYQKRYEEENQIRQSKLLNKQNNLNYIPFEIQQQINLNNQNIIKLQNIYEDKWKGVLYNIKTTSPTQKNLQQPQVNVSLKDQNKKSQTQQSQIKLSNIYVRNSSQNSIPYIQVLGVPNQNRNNQIGQYLKLKQQTTNKEKEYFLSNLESTPIHANSQQYQQTFQSLLETSIMSQQNSFMLPENSQSSYNKGYEYQNQVEQDNSTQFLQTQDFNLTNKQNIQSNSKTSYRNNYQNNNRYNIIKDNSYDQIFKEYQQCSYQKPQYTNQLLKERHKNKLNQFLHKNQSNNIYIQNDNCQSSNKEITQVNDNTRNNQKERCLSEQKYFNKSFQADTSNNDKEQDEINSMKNKSLVRFNLNQEKQQPQRHQSFSYNRSQTPEKSSLKKLNQTQNCNGQFMSDQKYNQKLSRSIDLTNQKYHYSNNPQNLLYYNIVDKIENQNQEVNPKLLTQTNPIYNVNKSKQFQQQQYHQNNSQLPAIV